MQIKVHWKTFHPFFPSIFSLSLSPIQNLKEDLKIPRGMYSTIQLLEIMRLSISLQVPSILSILLGPRNINLLTVQILSVVNRSKVNCLLRILHVYYKRSGLASCLWGTWSQHRSPRPQTLPTCRKKTMKKQSSFSDKIAYVPERIKWAWGAVVHLDATGRFCCRSEQ